MTPGRVSRRWPGNRAWLTVLVFLLLACYVIGYAGVRFNVDSPLIPDRSFARMFRVVNQRLASASPGYHAIVTISMAAGTGPMGIVVLQVALATLAAVRLEVIGRALGGAAAGLVSVGLFVLNPDQVRWHAYVLPDSFYTTTLILAVAASQDAWTRPSHRRLFLALAWALAAGTLNATGYLLVPLIIAFWFRGKLGPGPRGAACATLVATAMCILVMLPIISGAIARGTAERERPDLGVVIRDFRESWQPMPAPAGATTSSTVSALAYACEHPRQSIHLATLRVLATLAHVRPYYTLRHNLALLVFLAPIYLLAVLGVIGARRQPLALFLVGVVAVHLLVIAITSTDWDGRSLLAILPLIGLLAARGLIVPHWPRGAKVPLAFAALLIVTLIPQPALLTRLALQFRVDDPLPSDAPVLLLGGDRDRPERAAELYLQGGGSVVLLGSDADLTFNRDMMIKRGIPPRAIISLGPTIGTREEAWRVRDYAAAHREIRRITVVTTAFHTVRARWIFRHALAGSGIEVRVAASRDPRFDESNWYTSVDGVTAYSQEIFKMAYARLASVH